MSLGASMLTTAFLQYNDDSIQMIPQKFTILNTAVALTIHTTRNNLYQDMFEDLQELYGRGTTEVLEESKLRKFPSSSCQDLMILFEKEARTRVLLMKIRERISPLLSIKRGIVDIRSKMGDMKNENVLIRNKIVDLRNEIVDMKNEIVDITWEYFPSEMEFYEAGGLGIVQLEDTYDLRKEDILKGNIVHQNTSFPSSHKLTEWDTKILANTSLVLNKLDKRVEWLEEGLSLSQEKSSWLQSVNEAKVAHDKHVLQNGFIDKMQTREKLYNPVLEKSPQFKQFVQEKEEFINKTKIGNLGRHLTINTKVDLVQRPTVKKLCAGEQPPSQSCTYTHQDQPCQQTQYLCTYLHHGQFYLMLGPFLLETHSLRPFVGTIHRLTTTRENQWFRQRLKGGMRPTTYTGQGEKLSFSRDRTSKVRFVSDGDSEVTRALTARLHLATRWRLWRGEDEQLEMPNSHLEGRNLLKYLNRLGMQMEDKKGSENYRVMNYGPGGAVLPHVDTTGGARMATILIYISSGVVGGHTVFPRLNLWVPPVAESGVVWYGVDSGGQEDFRSVHVGCPVLRGNKIVAQKLIVTKGQWDTVKCGRKPGQDIARLGLR